MLNLSFQGIKDGCEASDCDKILLPVALNAGSSKVAKKSRGGLVGSHGGEISETMSSDGGGGRRGVSGGGDGGAGRHDDDDVQGETRSCPSSPSAETDCSSGFSTLRRRSVTMTEKVRPSRSLVEFHHPLSTLAYFFLV